MRLELASYHVSQLEFADQTHYKHGVLSINRDELVAILTDEFPIDRVDIALAHPGDKIRIVHILDTIEPRYKVAGRGRIFSGLLGPPDTVGSGRTHRLQGMTLMAQGVPTGYKE